MSGCTSGTIYNFCPISVVQNLWGVYFRKSLKPSIIKVDYCIKKVQFLNWFFTKDFSFS